MSSLLAVIDMQRIFADPASEWRTPRFDEVVAPIQQLVTAHEHVVFTRFVAPAQPKGAWADYYRRWPFALQPPGSPAYQVVADFTPGKTLDATTFGKWNDELAALLGDDDTLVLAGVSTDCCVLSTALAAADAGVRVRVVSDACAGADDVSHRRALDAMALYAPHIEITTVAELLG